jgi:hypothetical protein
MDRVFSLTLLSTLYSIPQRQQQVFTISFWLSPSHVWACSIYLFRQHIISFWRSHFTPVTAILGAARRNESHLPGNAAKRMPIKKSIRGSSKKRPEGLSAERRRRR